MIEMVGGKLLLIKKMKVKEKKDKKKENWNKKKMKNYIMII